MQSYGSLFDFLLFESSETTEKFCIHLLSADNFQNQFFGEKIQECILIGPDLGPTVCKAYQLMTLVRQRVN